MIFRIFIILLLAITIQGQGVLDSVKILEHEGRYEDAILLLKQNYDEQDTLQKLIFISTMGTLHGINMEYDKAFQLKEQAIQGFKAAGNDTLTSQALYGIAKLFSDRYEYDNNYKYLKEALSFARTRVDSAKIISNMGVYFRHQGQLDSTRILYLKGIEMYPEDGDPEFFYINYNNLAILEKTEGNPQKALDYYDKASEYASQKGNDMMVAAIDVNKTYVYYDLKEYEKAEALLNDREEIIMSLGRTIDKLNFDLIRYNIAEKLDKSSETLKYYKRYRKNKDSVDNLTLNTKIAEFEVKYETAKKEREIALKESELSKSHVQRQYLWGGLIAAVWLGLFGTLFYWSRNRYQKKLTQEKLHNLAVESMLSGQENERMRIAADLHDSLGGLLTTIKLHFEEIQHKIADWASTEKRESVTSLLDRASREVRRISHNMAPRALDLSGLNSALADLSTAINAAGSLQVSYEWHGGEIPEQDRIMVYRVVEEACNNAMKHAEASQLFIQVNVFDDGYSVLVEDDGKGFVDGDSEGMGLRNIRSRAAILKADVDIDSSVGKGTSVLLTKE